MSNTDTTTDDTAPEELMHGFRGRGFKSMLIFTIVIHAVLILATSLPGIIRNIAGGEESEMTAEERTELAVKEATASLREIAQRHGMTAQDLGTRFASPAARPATEPTTAPTDGTPTTPTAEDPKSAIEQELETTTPGPALPPIPETTEEDLFE